MHACERVAYSNIVCPPGKKVEAFNVVYELQVVFDALHPVVADIPIV